jgi:hypothetical protein
MVEIVSRSMMGWNAVRRSPEESTRSNSLDVVAVARSGEDENVTDINLGE